MADESNSDCRRCSSVASLPDINIHYKNSQSFSFHGRVKSWSTRQLIGSVCSSWCHKNIGKHVYRQSLLIPRIVMRFPREASWKQ